MSELGFLLHIVCGAPSAVKLAPGVSSWLYPLSRVYQATPLALLSAGPGQVSSTCLAPVWLEAVTHRHPPVVLGPLTLPH